jgi:DNA-binding phage protein
VNTAAIRKLVKRSKQSIAELSKQTGLGTARLYQLLDEAQSEQNITFDTLQRLAVVLSQHLEENPNVIFKQFFESDLKHINKKLKKAKS